MESTTDSNPHHVSWANSEVSRKVPITMQSFAKAFDYFDQDDADLAFTQLLSSPLILQGKRTTAMSNYMRWKRNNSSHYWAQRVASSKAKISKKRTAGILVEESEPIAKLLIEEKDEISIEATPVCNPHLGKRKAGESQGNGAVAEGHTAAHAHKEPRRGEHHCYTTLSLNRLSTESGDLSFVTQDSIQSDSRFYTWNFLDGNGRVDSNVHSHWVHNGTNIGVDLMKFRDRTIENNGGLTEAHQKLAVNFIFLIEEEYRTDGLQGEIEDKIWDAICDAIKDSVPPLPKEVATEALEWFQKMASSKMEVFEQMLDDSPPSDRSLTALLRIVSNNSQYWSTHMQNEDTYLKPMLGPLLDVYFGKLRHAKSDWTPIHDDTKVPETSTLFLDYGTATMIGNRRYFVLLLEGKIAGNNGSHQMWDDLSKLGNEMKLALDSILKLGPTDEVSVMGILVRENCIHGIRQVKVHESSCPKVPLSWLRPSVNKPRRQQISD
ncbi:hypothetical protein BGX21_004660 [Mortierella sp. AD011]|nr:hypothetical protein BGX20_004889 [Mortierella sp. AD010]KAF9372818.1 hypothetical protein BGX21_004660 [Mortierella sp. AD011]